MSRQIMIVTGEASGDLYGSLLAPEIRRIAPDTDLVGVGGRAMREAGVDIFLDSTQLSVVGFSEALVRLPRLRAALCCVKREIVRRRPDLLVLIDYPGMNLRLAKAAKSAGIKVMYYISPQVWAWGKNRINLIKRNVDKMLVILPFEVEIYRREGMDVTYVGHPLSDIVRTTITRDAFFQRMGLEPRQRLVSLLPGSRHQEIRQHLKPLVEAAALLAGKHRDLSFVLVTLPGFESEVSDEIAKSGIRVAVASEYRHEAIAYSNLAMTCSGTVTLEAAILGTPMIVMYRLSSFSWMLGRLIVRVPYISLVNLVARDRVVPELLQGEVNAANLAREAEAILEDDNRRGRMVAGLAQVRAGLGSGGATRKAAETAVGMMS
jgi:lipid-A-disaccharide synthase